MYLGLAVYLKYVYTPFMPTMPLCILGRSKTLRGRWSQCYCTHMAKVSKNPKQLNTFLIYTHFFFFFWLFAAKLSHPPPLISLSQHISYSDEAKCCPHCSYSLSHIVFVALWSGSKPFHTTSFILSQRAQKTTKLYLGLEFGAWFLISTSC